MKENVYFFWCRWRRAVCMDSSNRINNAPSYYWTDAVEWIDAYKATLSKNKLSEFEKEWNRYEKMLVDFQNGVKGAENPFKLS